MSNNYIPNFNDPRVIKRIKTAIGFTCGVLSETKPHSWSSRYIDKYLGVSSNQLSKYLRENLLICTDEYYRYNSGDKDICKKYILNKKGLEHLRENLNLSNIHLYPSVLQVVKQDHYEELANGKFEYKDQASRLWHPLQRYRKQYKQQILADHGYEHQYDIECCAPTLLLQYSRMLPEVRNESGKYISGPNDEYLAAIDSYLKDRTSIRQRLACDMEIPEDDAKSILTALFAGAVISQHSDTDIYQILNGDISRIEYLKQDAFVSELRSDIKTMWEYLRPCIPLRTKKQANGKERRLPASPKEKWYLYFELERRVLDVVRDYMKEKDIKCFLEHDGWSSNKELDLIDLRDTIRTKTGFNLRFDYKKIAVYN